MLERKKLDYLKIKKIDVEIDDSTVVGSGLPEKNTDYTMFIDVALKSKEVTQVEAEDIDEDTYWYFETTGAPRLIPKNWGLTSTTEATTTADEHLESPEVAQLADTLPLPV